MSSEERKKPPVKSDSWVHKRVGDYILGETIGQGSFGKVKIAKNVKTNEKVAVKIIDKSTISDVEDVERVYRETFVLTTLKHENIIRLYEVMDTPSSLCLAMEFAGGLLSLFQEIDVVSKKSLIGGELHDLVQRRGRLNETEACRLFHQIVSGVEYCHRMKIIHRDLKLENILIDRNGTIKIADFGLSNSIKFGQKMDTNCGTPSYTCPEQITQKKYAGASADIWSMGIILFTMVCGFLPFEASNVPALYNKIKQMWYKIPSFISSDCENLIQRMLTLDPNQRASLAEIRSHSWYLMDYNIELIEKIKEIPEVTSEDIGRARRECNEVGELEMTKNDLLNSLTHTHRKQLLTPLKQESNETEPHKPETKLDIVETKEKPEKPIVSLFMPRGNLKPDSVPKHRGRSKSGQIDFHKMESGLQSINRDRRYKGRNLSISVGSNGGQRNKSPKSADALRAQTPLARGEAKGYFGGKGMKFPRSVGSSPYGDHPQPFFGGRDDSDVNSKFLLPRFGAAMDDNSNSVHRKSGNQDETHLPPISPKSKVLYATLKNSKDRESKEFSQKKDDSLMTFSRRNKPHYMAERNVGRNVGHHSPLVNHHSPNSRGGGNSMIPPPKSPRYLDDNHS